MHAPRKVDVLAVVDPRAALLVPAGPVGHVLVGRERVRLAGEERLADGVVRLGVGDIGGPRRQRGGRGRRERRGGRLEDGAADRLAEEVGREEAVDEVRVEELVVEVLGEQGRDLGAADDGADGLEVGPRVDVLAAGERLARDRERLHLGEQRRLLVVEELGVGRERVDGERRVSPAKARVSERLERARSRGGQDALVDDGSDDAAHGQVRVGLPALGELVDLALEVDVADVASLDDEVVGGRENLEAVDLAENVTRSEGLGRANDDRDVGARELEA